MSFLPALSDSNCNSTVRGQRRVQVCKLLVYASNDATFCQHRSEDFASDVASLGFDLPALVEKPSGVRELDAMLGGQGYFRGSTVLVSGTAGTGKTSLAAHFADAACRRGERVLYFLFEKSPHQLIRNMRSIGRSWTSGL